jgi:hypothetical protein
MSVKVSVITTSIRPEGLRPVQESLAKQTYKDFEWLVELGIPERGHDLNAAMNRALRRATGSLVVIWQDWMEGDEKILERIVDLHETIGIREKVAITYPVGKVDDLKDKSNPTFDWRLKTDGYVPSHQWETDFASAPLAMFKEIGGYDEEMDKGWSWDNVNVATRAEYAGYLFRSYPIIWVHVWDHDKFSKHPFRGKSENGDRMKDRAIQFASGEWKLGYL